MEIQKCNRTRINTPSFDPAGDDHTGWSDAESQASTFGDQRLQNRFRRLLGEVYDRIGDSIPYACQRVQIATQMTKEKEEKANGFAALAGGGGRVMGAGYEC